MRINLLDTIICFDECVKNYVTEKSLETSKCEVTMDIKHYYLLSIHHQKLKSFLESIL